MIATIPFLRRALSKLLAGIATAEQARWAIGSVWLAIALWAYLAGTGLVGSMEQAAAGAAEMENELVCRRLGFAPGEGNFALCASELAGVRQAEKARTELALTGLY